MECFTRVLSCLNFLAVIRIILKIYVIISNKNFFIRYKTFYKIDIFRYKASNLCKNEFLAPSAELHSALLVYNIILFIKKFWQILLSY